MLAPAAGVAFNFDESDRTAVFADLELNYTFDNGGYVGTGVGVWDLFDGDNITPNLLIHLGAPITRYADDKAKLLFVVESRLFSRQDGIRPLVRAMREGLPFYYLPDQDFGLRDSVFVPFFGVPAATITGVSRIARLAGAVVVPAVTRQLPGAATNGAGVRPPRTMGRRQIQGFRNTKREGQGRTARAAASDVPPARHRERRCGKRESGIQTR